MKRFYAILSMVSLLSACTSSSAFSMAVPVFDRNDAINPALWAGEAEYMGHLCPNMHLKPDTRRNVVFRYKEYMQKMGSFSYNVLTKEDTIIKMMLHDVERGAKIAKSTYSKAKITEVCKIAAERYGNNGTLLKGYLEER